MIKLSTLTEKILRNHRINIFVIYLFTEENIVFQIVKSETKREQSATTFTLQLTLHPSALAFMWICLFPSLLVVRLLAQLLLLV